MLRTGGVAIVDDLQLWSGRIVADFLDEEPVWERVVRTPRFGVYRLLADARTVLARWWGLQPFVTRHSTDLGPPRPSLLRRLLSRT